MRAVFHLLETISFTAAHEHLANAITRVEYRRGIPGHS
jgi:hypothetical protein